jgi:hypothetical protein
MAKKKTQQVPTGRQYDGLLSSVSELLEQARHTSARVARSKRRYNRNLLGGRAEDCRT